MGLSSGFGSNFGLIGSGSALIGSGVTTGGGAGCLLNSITNNSGFLTASNLRLGITNASKVCSKIEHITAHISMLLLAFIRPVWVLLE